MGLSHDGSVEIIPFHVMDNLSHNKAMVLDVTFQFDDVLDPDRLESSLRRLLATDCWRKFGAQVQEKPGGLAQYHVPESSDTGHSSAAFAAVHHAMSINQHPTASRLPRAGKHLAIFEDPKIFHSLVTGPNSVSKFQDYVTGHSPPFSVYVQTFEDATLLTVNFSHSLTDAMGLSSFLTAWTGILNKNERPLPPMAGYREDPAEISGSKAVPEDYVYYPRMLSRFGFLIFVFFAIVEMIFYPIGGARVIRVPAASVQKLKEDAMSDVRNSGRVRFVSEGDVLLAWWAKSLTAAMKFRPQNPVAIGNIVSFRGSIPTLPAGHDFVGNAVTPAYWFCTAHDLSTRSIGDVASQFRSALEGLRTQGQFESYLALLKRCIAKGQFPIFGEPNMFLVHWTNWSRAGFYEMDFSGAVSKTGIPLDKRAVQLGRPTYLNLNGYENGFSSRNSGCLLGRDAEGNYWIRSHLRESVWDEMEKQVQSLSCAAM